MRSRLSILASAVGVAVVLATAAPATAAVFLKATSATFHWAPASGPVLGYAVYVARNGSGFGPIPEVITPAAVTRAKVVGSQGERIVVRVAAFRAGGLGPFSPLSEEIRFLRR